MHQNNIKAHTCCIFGHRRVNKTELLTNAIYNIIEDLIVNEKVDTFLFGSKSQFNDMCYKIVTEFREKYSHIKRIYVRAEFPYIDDNYKSFLLQNYEDTYYPEKMINAGKAAYVERNYEMINNGNFCICYYDENYTTQRRKNNRGDLIDFQQKSGTKLAYSYAKRKNIVVKNTFYLSFNNQI